MMISNSSYPGRELSRLRHKALVYIAYVLLLYTLTVVDSTSSDATAATASKQNLETFSKTLPQTLVDSRNYFASSNPETLHEHTGDKFVDANSEFDANDDEENNDDEQEIFHDAWDEFEDEPQDGATEKSNGGLFERLKGATKSVVAPAWDYYDLIARFRKWRNEYNRLQVAYGNSANGEPRLRNSLDVMRLEYAQVDKMLVNEMCHGGKDDDEPVQYDMDFIWKVLKMLINRLELKLDELKRAGVENLKISTSEYDEETHATLKQIEANATDRAKRIIARSAGHLAKREFIRLTELLLYDMLASYVANSDKVDANGMTTLMGHIEPFVFLIGTANSPLLASYVRNVEFRSVLNLAKQYYSALSCPRPVQANAGGSQAQQFPPLISATTKLVASH